MHQNALFLEASIAHLSTNTSIEQFSDAFHRPSPMSNAEETSLKHGPVRHEPAAAWVEWTPSSGGRSERRKGAWSESTFGLKIHQGTDQH